MYYVPTEQEVLILLNKPDIKTIKGIRDKAIIELMYSSALRRMEVAKLDINHINFEEKIVRVVNGKGNKDRVIPTTKEARKWLKIYLEKVRPLYNRNPQNKAFFLGEWGRRLSAGMVNEIIHYYSTNLKISAHSLRHAAATHMLKRG